MDLILIRHGLPIRHQTDDGSPADPPLSDEGSAQAEAVAEWLATEPLDRVYVSPMRRARETAAPLLKRKGMTAETEPRVAEFDRDADHYIPLEELKRTDYPAWRSFMEGGYERDPGFETFCTEAVAALEDITRRHPGERVAVVCHGGVINVWAGVVLDLGPRLFFQPGYTSINRFRSARSGQQSVVSLNEQAHLRGLPSDVQIASST